MTDVTEAPVEEAGQEDAEPQRPVLRPALAVAPSVIASAVALGAVFRGAGGYTVAIGCGVVGLVTATQAARRRTTAAVHATVVLGVAGVGLLVLLPDGVGAVLDVGDSVRSAVRSRAALRPPADLVPGFRALVAWVTAVVGFTSGWLAIELRRPALGLLAPLPLVVLAAISVPPAAKLPIGVAVLVLFVLGLTMLSSLDGDASPGIGYELRRAGRALPLVGALVVVIVLLSRSGILFPKPYYDPVREARRPKAVPLSAVDDRVLFEVRSKSTGPWRLGLLDVYDGSEWRLPPYQESQLSPVPRNGIVDPDTGPVTRADFAVKGLSGNVLPGVPGPVAINARGPRLAYDPRTGTIRVAEGQLATGLEYTVTGAGLPTEQQLLALADEVAPDVERFTAVPEAPPAVAALLAQAPARPAWARLQFLRTKLLETVVAAGSGQPVAVPPERVDDLLAGSKEGSPYEIVAAQALLARWAGVPSRIAYGYDGGDETADDVREVRPRHGATWLEVHFPGFGWVPVVGAPLKAKPSLDGAQANPDTGVVASDEISVQVFVPLRLDRPTVFFEQVRRIVLLVLPLVLALLLLWTSVPVLRKALRRRRRRAWATRTGHVARIEVAYAELRDYCTDLGVGRAWLTPLGFVAVLAPDDEHLDLAWLVTRALYGDLRDTIEEEDALAAEEMSRSVRRRLASAQPFTLRFVAVVSRLSLKDPYVPSRPSRKEVRDEPLVAA